MAKRQRSQPNPETLDRILLAILAGRPESTIARDLPDLSAADLAEAVKLARSRIADAAAHDPTYELGRQRLRLDDLYRRTIAAGENRTALAAAAALGRLLALERLNAPNPGTAANPELEAIRAHLLPLGLGDESTTTPELARLAVMRLTELEAIHHANA